MPPEAKTRRSAKAASLGSTAFKQVLNVAPEQGDPPLGMDPVDAAQAYRMAVMAQNKSKTPPRPWMWTLSNNPSWEGGGGGGGGGAGGGDPDWGIVPTIAYAGGPAPI